MRPNVGVTAVPFVLFCVSVAPVRAQDQFPRLRRSSRHLAIRSSSSRLVPRQRRGTQGSRPWRKDFGRHESAAVAREPVLGDCGRRLGARGTCRGRLRESKTRGEDAVGRIKDEPKVSHLGMDLLRSIAISEGLTQVVKYAARRERPDHSGRNSFPSGRG